MSKKGGSDRVKWGCDLLWSDRELNSVGPGPGPARGLLAIPFSEPLAVPVCRGLDPIPGRTTGSELAGK